MTCAVAICLLAVAAPAAAEDENLQLSRQAKTLIAMTPAEFAASTSLTDDDLDLVATITTEPGFRETHGLMKRVWRDNFLLAFIDKRTGATRYQLYQRIAYRGWGWKKFIVGNYETPAGLESVKVVRIARDRICLRSRSKGHCTYVETVAIPIEPKLLKSIAADYKAGTAKAWKFKFKAQSGDDYTDGLMPAEAIGLLTAVHRYRIARNLAAEHD